MSWAPARRSVGLLLRLVTRGTHQAMPAAGVCHSGGHRPTTWNGVNVLARRYPARRLENSRARTEPLAGSHGLNLSRLRWPPSLSHVAASSSAAPGVERSADEDERFVLGIETSCDETGAAVVSTRGRVLSEAVASQGDIHAPFGGVVPSLAARAHAERIDPLVDGVLLASGIRPERLSAIAVTVGPGLALCLRVGVAKARRLASLHRVPLVPVHHMEAHALVARLAHPGLDFPFLTLLVSGGHNLLAVAHDVGRYTELGTALDDALGEAYDKTARLLGLDVGAGGGAALERLATEGNPRAVPFPTPLRGRGRHRESCDFSYAGLKTAVRCAIERRWGAEGVPPGELPPPGDPSGDRQARADIAASFQRAAVAHLRDRTTRGVTWATTLEPGLTALVVAGGVASNETVRAALAVVASSAALPLPLVAPPLKWCTDNGAMIAWAGVERLRLGMTEPPPPADEPIDARVELRPRWPLGERHTARAAEDAVAMAGSRGLKKTTQPSLSALTELANPRE